MPDGQTLLGERAMLNGFRVPGRISAGGGCRIYDTLDGHVALNLSRPSDVELLPALFRRDAVGDVVSAMAGVRSKEVVAQGRILGLAIASFDEAPERPAICQVSTGREVKSGVALRVVDLSSLWAGPLAAHLLQLGGAEVIKVESRNRPDSMRDGDPALFALLNQGKAQIALDLRDGQDRDELLALIRSADIVIEAARPRALLQLGIDADALVRTVPGLRWLTITGHGHPDWIGFGDDCGVAGGLSRALFDATGKIGFVGDAMADPLTGIFAALAALRQTTSGRSIISMSGVVAQAMASEDPQIFVEWAKAQRSAIPIGPASRCEIGTLTR